MSEPDLSPTDLRIFDRLKAALDAFDLGSIDVPALITDVGTSLDSFEEVNPTFVEELRGVWWPVQYALALSIDQERELTELEQRDVGDAVAVLQQHLADAGMA